MTILNSSICSRYFAMKFIYVFRPPHWVGQCKGILSVTLISIYNLQNTMWHDKSKFTVLDFPRTTPIMGGDESSKICQKLL